MCNACPYLYSGNEAKQQPKIIVMFSKIQYRIFNSERMQKEYNKLSTAELVNKLARLQANLNSLCAEVASPYTTVQESKDTVGCIMWVKQDIVSVTSALSNRD